MEAVEAKAPARRQGRGLGCAVRACFLSLHFARSPLCPSAAEPQPNARLKKFQGLRGLRPRPNPPKWVGVSAEFSALAGKPPAALDWHRSARQPPLKICVRHEDFGC